MKLYNEYFCGNKASDYAIEHGYLDYATLAKAFDAVLNNGIMEATADLGYWYQVSGVIDYYDEIEELKDQRDDLESIQCDLIDEDKENTPEYEEIEEKIDAIDNQIADYENAMKYPPEIFQYYIVSDQGADILKDCNEVVFYNEELDMHIWGVTHYGTAWNYVLTDIPINCGYDD